MIYNHRAEGLGSRFRLLPIALRDMRATAPDLADVTGGQLIFVSGSTMAIFEPCRKTASDDGLGISIIQGGIDFQACSPALLTFLIFTSCQRVPPDIQTVASAMP